MALAPYSVDDFREPLLTLTLETGRQLEEELLHGSNVIQEFGSALLELLVT